MNTYLLFFILWCPMLLENNPEGMISEIYNPVLGVGYVFLSNLIANGLYLVFFIPDWRKLKLVFDLCNDLEKFKLHPDWIPSIRPEWMVGIKSLGWTPEFQEQSLIRFKAHHAIEVTLLE